MNIVLRYFPAIEFGAFVVSIVLILLVRQIAEVGIWFQILLAVLSYLLFLSTSNIIILSKEKLVIYFLNPLQGKYVINVKAIKKLNSNQSYELESDVLIDTVYPIFRRSYDLEYVDERNNEHSVRFRFLNRKKEVQIVNELKQTSANATNM